jgi:hypothetical protein
MLGVMFLSPPSWFTRVGAVVVGSIWAALGAWWSYWVAIEGSEFPTRRTSHLCFALLTAGVMLIGSGLRPTRPRPFEDEVPDASPEGLGEPDDF